jgi:hypothetical protein
MRGFSTSFPCGAAGIGLLLLRCAALPGLLHCAGALVDNVWTPILLVSTTCLLSLGLLTPFAAGACVLCELLCLSARAQHDIVVLSTHVVCAVALGLLGPGAYSLDAKLFGRRRLLGNDRAGAD